MDLLSYLLKLIYLTIGAVVIWFIYLVLYPIYCPMDEYSSTEGFCGTVNSGIILDTSTATNAYEGKVLFRELCAACHHKNMRSNSTGPGLGNTFRNWNNDTLTYQSYVNDSENYVLQSKDERIIDLKKDYSFGLKSHKNTLDYDEIKSLLLYIDQ